LYEEAREKVRGFLNAREAAEIIYTRGTTEAINLVGSSWGRSNLKSGDEVIISAAEHHSNIVPWQLICEQTGAVLKVIPVNDGGELRMDEYQRLLSPRTKMVAVTHLSNALGTIVDVQRITELAHGVGAKVLIDGAQWVAHFPTDVQAIGCDFYCFSGHKLYGPTGIGVLYGRREVLDAMPPYQGGGDMIETVTFEKTTYAPLPNKFEAGTPNIAGAIGLGAAIEYLNALGFSQIAYEHDLLEYATKRLSEIPGLRIVGTAAKKASVISFVMEDPPIASLDIGMGLDREGVAVRTGHHCCMPLMNHYKIPGTARVSLAMYNTRADVDALVAGLKKIQAQAAAARESTGEQETNLKSQISDLKFPPAAGSSPNAIAEELAEVFEFLEEKNAKNEQLLDFAKVLPRYFETLKRLTERVPGCMSQVYIVARKTPGTKDRFEFVADADAEIVRGEIAILQKLYSGQRAQDVLNFDIDAFFTRIGLEHFLTNQRRTGLASMVNRIRLQAQAIESAAAAATATATAPAPTAAV
jgi:cysteine desulfurase/selenocysteine lyase